jgi:hypothetical protein
MSRSTQLKLLLAATAVLFCFGLLEVGVRLLTKRDENGNLFFGQTRLRPYRFPAQSAKRLVEEYLARPNSNLMYDADLGWAPRPLVAHNNEEGFYSTAPASELKNPVPGRVRIALFGGSYTQCTFENGWWRVVERCLREAGVNADVMNYGVAGFGMDQAYLRWKKFQRKADVVLFGFVAGNVQDNMNLVRFLQNPSSGIPFTKPRLLGSGTGLEVINVPTCPPERLPELMEHLDQWGLIKHDYYYHPDDYASRWWRHSRLVALVEGKIQVWKSQSAFAEFCDLTKEPAQLSLAIMQALSREAKAADSKYYVLHLPTEWDVRAIRAKGVFAYDALYRKVKEANPVIQPEDELLAVIKEHGYPYVFHDGHFTEAANEIIGKRIAQRILQDLKRR